MCFDDRMLRRDHDRVGTVDRVDACRKDAVDPIVDCRTDLTIEIDKRSFAIGRSSRAGA